MKKFSKSDQTPEQQWAQFKSDKEKLQWLLHDQPHRGTQPGDGCRVFFKDGTSAHGVYAPDDKVLLDDGRLIDRKIT